MILISTLVLVRQKFLLPSYKHTPAEADVFEEIVTGVAASTITSVLVIVLLNFFVVFHSF